MFMGHSMVDAHLVDYQTLNTAIHNKKTTNVDTIIERCLEGDTQRMDKFFKDGIMRELRIVNNDFSFNNEIERSFEVKDTLVQKLLLETILEINSKPYQNLMMQILGRILDNDEYNHNLVNILGFFKRPDGISEDI